jgi:hypothetical protein
MACPHKFERFLNLERLDFEPITLIVGTFNPAWPEGNNAEWFYGRTRNNYLWDVLPRMYNPNFNLRRETHVQWKQFCSANRIALTDVIHVINDADENNEEHQEIMRTYLDTSFADYFEDFTFTNLVALIEQHPTIQHVYLTRQEGVELFDEQWSLVEQFSENNPNRNLHFRKLLTPSASARFQLRPYKLANPNDRTPLRNFIFQSWQEQWHQL